MKIVQTDYTDTKREKDGVEYETPDGQTFLIEPPLLWTPEQRKEMRDAQEFAKSVAEDEGRDDDTADTAADLMAAALLGGDHHLAAFKAAGGNVNVLLEAFGERNGPVGNS